ncbi:MAG TPA: hypothetical protein VFE78_10500 [Gemmataceae bacterium]|jgi:hypothetical protein|nr:hypothetical protein [Gemmataceae bacterium]
MSRCLGAATAGVLLLAVAGCSLDSFLTPFPGTPDPRQVVAAPLAQVAARLEEGLSEAGVPVLTKPVGREMRLAGMTKSGKVFCLHLYAEKVAGADRTLVRVKWDRGADDPFWQMVLELAATAASDAG